MKYSENAEPDNKSDSLSAEINAFREKLAELEKRQRECLQAQTIANHEITLRQPQLSQKFKKKRSDELRLTALKIELEKVADPNNQEDAWLSKQNAEVEKLSEEIAALYSKKLAVMEKLKVLNSAFTARLTSVNEHLTPLFSKFASKFLGVKCELVISERSKGGKPVTFMHPRFNEKDRLSLIEVSESQRFFIDQAFRMALITLFSNLNDETTTFFIVETPEGSLDLAYERNVAEMYLDFASLEHSIVITSNLNSSNFLQGLYSKLGGQKSKSSRTLDLLHHGRLSSVQGDGVTQFNSRLEQLGLPFSL